MKAWEVKRASRPLDDQRTQHTIACTDPDTKLVVRCVAIEYRDYPAVEWTLYFKNSGRKATPILADIRALDVAVRRGAQGEFLLHHHAGSQANSDDYRPLETALRPEATAHFAPGGGWASSDAWPYYNLQWSGEGLMIAVGWPGQWATNFSRDKQDGLRITAGQETTHFKLLPDEEVRSPLIALQFWKGGDWIRAQNIWRRWMVAHNMPRPGGRTPPPLLGACSSGIFDEMQHANEENQKLFYYGIPEAKEWMADRVMKIMKEEGIDIYRQDFNFPPLNYWRNNDVPDRKGITEIRHCVGYLAYWDELRRRNPNMLTDECASGGRRNDLESMRRAVPLHKSDMNYGDLEAKHTQFYGLALWHPYFATGSGLGDAYSARTAFAPMLVLGCDMRREDLDLARMVQAELDRTAVRAAGGRTQRFRRCDTPFGRVHAVAADHNVPVVEQGHPGTTVLPVGDVLQLVVGLIERERSPSTGTSCGMSIANDTALAPSVFTSAATVYRWPANRRMSGFCQAAAVTTSGLALPSSSMVFLPS